MKTGETLDGGREYSISRREFMRAATGLTVSAGLLPWVDLEAAPSTKWPVSCRDNHLRAAAQPDSWACAKAIGAEGVEVGVEIDLSCPSLFQPSGKYTLATAEGVQAVKADAARNQCRVTAFALSNRFDERLEDELKCARALVKVAQELEADAIRIDVWPHRLGEKEFLPFAIDACKRLCEIAEGTPIRYGIENHGKVTNNPEFLERLFEGVGSPKIGLTLDTANFYWYGHPLADLYGIYEKFAPRVVHTHCKSIKFPDDKKNVRRPMGWEYDKYNCPIYEGDLDFKRLTEILRKAGYRGDLCLEDESLGKYPASERAGILQKELAMLKGLR
ncbi:MAG TPA: sugar phosphate isomerase/epimerase family protein [Verrucomicrobiae bacterium]